MDKCINTKHPEFIELAKQANMNPLVLKSKIGVWQEKNNSDDFPTLEELGIGQEAPIANIKEGVPELFESNPELANEVYEALGFKPDSKESNINIEEIEAVKAAIKNLRDEDGSIPDNKLGLFRKLHKKIRFLQNDLLSNINNAISEFIETNKLSESDARYFRKLATIRDNFQELVDDFNKAKNTNYTITEIMSFFSNDMNLQESIKNKSEDNINKNQEYEKKLLQGNNFEANKDYTANELDSFVQQHGSKQVKFIWNIIKAVAQKLGVTTRFMLDGTHKIPQYSAGHYLNGKIENKASLFDNPTQMARIIVHELVHGVTTYILKAVEQNNIKILSKLTTRQLNAVKKLNALFNELKKDKDFDDTYGTKNTHELLAELTNESFVEKLKAKNIFEKILETIFEIFNIPFNAYTESIKILEDLISNPIEDNRYEGDLGEGYSLYSQKNNQITSQQKQQAISKFQEYINATGRQDIEGFKDFVQGGSNNIKPGVEELFNENPELANTVYETLGFKTKPDIILPIGTSGSGKSTFIKSLPQENLVVIEPDAMRVEFTGDMNNKSKDKEIYEEAANRAIQAIKQGKQVVFDTTNLTKDKRLPFIEAIKKAIPTANIQYKLMELNPELAKQRIKAQLARGENRAAVSDETIDRHAASYKQMLEDIKNEPISNFEITPQQKQEAQQLYSEYLDTIFPDSKVKDIVYHGSYTKFDEFDENKIGTGTTSIEDARMGKGFYFTKNDEEALQWGTDFAAQYEGITVQDLKNEGRLKSVVLNITNDKDIQGDEIVAKNKEQIHILGSKQDIEGFKSWVDSNQSNIQYQKQIDLQAEQDSVLEEFANSLSERFNISFDLVSEEEARSMLPEYANEPAFFDVSQSKAYLVEGIAGKTSTVHEIFTHPFLIKIEKDDPELYNNLLKEAKSDQDIVSFVEENYAGYSDKTKDHEIIARAIDLQVQGKLDSEKHKNLIEVIMDFFSQLASTLKEIFNTEKEITSLSTLEDVVTLVLEGKSFINLNTLGIKTETENTMFQIIGLKAIENIKDPELKKNLKDKLKKAKKLEKEGENPDYIWEVAHFERGEDGIWKLEVADVEFDAKVFESHKNNIPNEEVNIEHYIGKESPFFELYPELKDVKVKLMEGDISAYNEGERTIKLGKEKTESEVYFDFLHEFQHFIQRREGFSLGGSDEYAFRMLPRKVFDKVFEDSKQRIFRSLEKSVRNQLKNPQKLTPQEETMLRNIQKVIELSDKNLLDYQDKVELLDYMFQYVEMREDNPIDKYLIYYWLLGEREATNTKERAKMSMQERMKIRPTKSMPEAPDFSKFFVTKKMIISSLVSTAFQKEFIADLDLFCSYFSASYPFQEFVKTHNGLVKLTKERRLSDNGRLCNAYYSIDKKIVFVAKEATGKDLFSAILEYYLLENEDIDVQDILFDMVDKINSRDDNFKVSSTDDVIYNLFINEKMKDFLKTQESTMEEYKNLFDEFISVIAEKGDLKKQGVLDILKRSSRVGVTDYFATEKKLRDYPDVFSMEVLNNIEEC